MSTSDNICNDGASKSNDDVCEINNMLQNMSTTTNNNTTDVNTCANCGKEGSDVNNTCNKCEQVKYCNAACKKKHRSKHKKKCDRHVAELHDKALFKQPPTLEEDCPICFLRIPSLTSGSRYNTCCGKVICSGCWYANAKIDLDKQLCAFCRTPSPKTGVEAVERLKKRVEAGDAEAIFHLGCEYRDGTNGVRQNFTKALELCHRAVELGHASAYADIGIAYDTGRGVEKDEKKAIHYYELAAMWGHTGARHNLGCKEVEEAGNMVRALKHYMIAAGGGYNDSLKGIKRMYEHGKATKDDYTRALRARQAYLDEIKSNQRDRAAAARDEYKYY